MLTVLLRHGVSHPFCLVFLGLLTVGGIPMNVVQRNERHPRACMHLACLLVTNQETKRLNLEPSFTIRGHDQFGKLVSFIIVISRVNSVNSLI